MASETVSRFFRSSAVCQPGLKSRVPVTPTFRAFPKRFQMFEGGLHFAFLTHDPDVVLHDVLQFALHDVGIFPVVMLKGPERFLREVFHCRRVDLA